MITTRASSEPAVPVSRQARDGLINAQGRMVNIVTTFLPSLAHEDDGAIYFTTSRGASATSTNTTSTGASLYVQTPAIFSRQDIEASPSTEFSVDKDGQGAEAQTPSDYDGTGVHHSPPAPAPRDARYDDTIPRRKSIRSRLNELTQDRLSMTRYILPSRVVEPEIVEPPVPIQDDVPSHELRDRLLNLEDILEAGEEDAASMEELTRSEVDAVFLSLGMADNHLRPFPNEGIACTLFEVDDLQPAIDEVDIGPQAFLVGRDISHIIAEDYHYGNHPGEASLLPSAGDETPLARYRDFIARQLFTSESVDRVGRQAESPASREAVQYIGRDKFRFQLQYVNRMLEGHLANIAAGREFRGLYAYKHVYAPESDTLDAGTPIPPYGPVDWPTGEAIPSPEDTPRA